MTLQMRPAARTNQILSPAITSLCILLLHEFKKVLQIPEGGLLQWRFRALMNSHSHLLVFLVKLLC